MGRSSRRAVYDPTLGSAVVQGTAPSIQAAADRLGVSSSSSDRHAPPDPLQGPAYIYGGRSHSNRGYGYNVDPYYGGGGASSSGSSASAVAMDENLSVPGSQDEVLDRRLHRIRDDRNKSGRRCLLLLLMCSVMAVVITPVALIASRNQGDVLIVKLEPPPDNLPALCNSKQRDEVVQCQMACEAAECCDFPATLDLSCLNANEDLCFQYHQGCGALLAPHGTMPALNASNIPAAPAAELEESCRADTLMTHVGVRLCSKLCLPAECCWEQGEIMSCSDADVCKGYAPCLHLRSAGKMDDSIPALIASKCDKDSVTKSEQSHLECDRACQMAQCCFDDDDFKCPHKKGDDFCQQYEACGVLYDGTVQPLVETTKSAEDSSEGAANHHSSSNDNNNKVHHATLPPLPHSIDISCDPEFIEEGSHLEACEKLCEPAKCCDFPVTQSRSCLKHHHKVCQSYHKHCAVLDGDMSAKEEDYDAAVPTVDPTKVDHACSTNSLATANGYEDCTEICDQAPCCWQDDAKLTTHCRNHAACDNYASCFYLKALTEVMPAISEAVTEACSRQRVQTPEGRTWCEQVCKQHRCCYDESVASCPFDNADEVCDQYLSCAHLNLSLDASQAQPPIPPADLVETCFSESDDDAQKECQEACDAAECCRIPEKVDGSCLHGHHAVCMQYNKACSGLVLDWGKNQDENVKIPPPHTELADVCSATSLATQKGFARCFLQCDQAKCCFEELADEGAPACTLNEMCNSYTPCLTLNALEYEDESITQHVAEKCTAELIETVQGRALCEKLCERHTCCWSGEIDAITVVMDDDEWRGDNDDLEIPKCPHSHKVCSQYAKCSLLLND